MKVVKKLLGSKVRIVKDEVVVRNKKDLVTVISFFKNSTFFQCKGIVDIVVQDIGNSFFMVRYYLLSVRFSRRLCVRCLVLKDIDSLTEIYKGSNWLEREAFDMFGLVFNGHKDLRRLLTDYGFKGNPLLKSFSSVDVKSIRLEEKDKVVK